LRRGAGYPVAGLVELDAECELPGAGRVTPWARVGGVALANSFGFGGANVALAFRSAP
jgi:3-oxoacyl-(acyl-carrier-protein) synthase